MYYATIRLLHRLPFWTQHQKHETVFLAITVHAHTSSDKSCVIEIRCHTSHSKLERVIRKESDVTGWNFPTDLGTVFVSNWECDR